MDDPFNLQRFVNAQRPVYGEVLSELGRGSKTTHWMWFIFPQIAGLGSSPTAQDFAISGREEAELYLKHELLGARLRECTRLVNQVQGRTSTQIFGGIDSMKFRSSMTLFAHVAGDDNIFEQALGRYFGGRRDPLTLDRL